MNSSLTIRLATENDAEALLNIYAHYVENTAITFEYDVPDTDEFARRIRTVLRTHPYLVAEQNGEPVGYAYASPFRTRIAYQHAAEMSIYVRQDMRGHGVGRALYEALEPMLLRQNVFVLYACVTLAETPDTHWTDGSVRFHTRMGYTQVAKHTLCGYKFSTWYSMIWMEKSIAPRPDAPAPFVRFSEMNGETE